MKKILALAMMVTAVALFTAGCGSSSTTSSDTPDITTVDGLPRATSPVVSSASGSISAKAISPIKANAATGVNLKDMDQTTFTSGMSMEMCQAANQTREVLNNAAMADKILCYVQNIVAANPTELSAIYDGEYHIVGLSISGGGEGTPDKVKMKITKNAAGAIVGFEMFACTGTTQMEYINQTITSTEVSITSKGFHSGSGYQGANAIEVTGALNSSGYFTSKSMELDQYGGTPDSPASQWSEATVTQYADKMVYNGYEAGSYGGNNYNNRVYSQYQLIDPNTSAANSSYDLQLVALGNGAAHGIYDHNNSQWTDNVSLGWNGDLKTRDDTVTEGTSSTTWVSLVSTDPRAVVLTAPTIAYTAAQTWTNCEGTAEVTVSAVETTLDAACSKLSLGNGNTWVDCYSAIGPGQ